MERDHWQTAQNVPATEFLASISDHSVVVIKRFTKKGGKTVHTYNWKTGEVLSNPNHGFGSNYDVISSDRKLASRTVAGGIPLSQYRNWPDGSFDRV